MFRNWWQSVWKTGRGTRSSARPPRREILIVSAIGILTFVITLSVLLSQSAARARRIAEDERRVVQASGKAPVLTADEISLSPEDFALPAMAAPGKPAEYVPYRPPTKKWTEEMIQAYWIPPREIALDEISAMNDEAIQRLFEKVP